VAYTDGGCSRLYGVGAFGWRALTVAGEVAMHCQGFANTTNNRMELMAVCDALSTLPWDAPLTIVSDSAYCVVGINHIPGWLRRTWCTVEGAPVKNRDLWETVLGLIVGRDLVFKQVKGHAGNAENEFVDALCTAEMKRLRRIMTAGGEVPLDLGYHRETRENC
jgi:ribonuclease HI